MKICHFFSTILFIYLPGTVGAQHHLSVVKISSHGISATVIHTAPGKTYLLGCAHGYQAHRGQDMRRKPMTIEVPWQPTPRPAKITLVAVDFDADLSLVRVDDGPWPHCVSVTTKPFFPKELTSAGYDRMKGLTAVPVQRCVLYTRERPVEGRSGGGLIDADGWVVGVVMGYELIPGGRGMYVDAKTIRSFLTRQGWGGPPTAAPELGTTPQPPVPPQVEQPYAGQPRGTPHNANRAPRRGFGGQWRAPQGQQMQQGQPRTQPANPPAGC